MYNGTEVAKTLLHCNKNARDRNVVDCAGTEQSSGCGERRENSQGSPEDQPGGERRNGKQYDLSSFSLKALLLLFSAVLSF